MLEGRLNIHTFLQKEDMMENALKKFLEMLLQSSKTVI